MALIKCPECGKEISDKASACIHCGYPIENTSCENASKEEQENNDQIKCPVCGSSNIHFITSQAGQTIDKGDACCGFLLCGPLGLLCGVKDNEQKTMRKCMNCNHEF